ncbi:EthD family reductase [Geomonas propionica]|uniref:EthD family reductase n=1 Tax=Geomonas propionica TaxID=2798582 RepID=A0ABS0YLZ4_9BACT|nr:EthD family reductase [Geomonas propionica]MBJ6798797.1 EthD family reductase [Geomonas propionica]
MIKLSVLYPASKGSKFDMDYYCNRHIPMIREKLGVACKGVEVEQGVCGRDPGSPAPFAALAHLLFDSLEAFQAAFAPHAETFRQDLLNYTDIQPVVQISSVKI